VALLVLVSCAAPAQDVRVVGTSPPADPPVTDGDAPATTGPGPTSADSASATTPATSPVFTPELSWDGCGTGMDCASFVVPLDHEDPAKGTMELAVRRHRAEGDRIGSLLVNPGGPGVPGTLMALAAEAYFSQEVLERFDIIGWDPRGTGDSEPIDCVDQIEPVFAEGDATPDSPEDLEVLEASSQSFVEGCIERSDRVLPYVATVDTAKDMDLLRQALGEETISYFGGSYGSELGGVWITLFPETVRAAVLDGASNPNSGWQVDTEEKLAGIERAFMTAMDACAADEDCEFHNDGAPLDAYDALMATLEDDPIELEGGLPPVNQAVLVTAVVSTLYSSSSWPLLYEALADAQDGDGERVYELFSGYLHPLGLGTEDHVFESLYAVNCLDDPGPTDPAQFPALDERFRQIAPRMGVGSAYNYTCAQWPYRPRVTVKVDGAGSPPVLVVGTTGDPVTPIESSQAMADALANGVLLTVDADQHTGYGANSCVTETVDRYLIDLTAPPQGSVCD
jgi:pimeloyl-ACP methyl ester carboxylesterase